MIKRRKRTFERKGEEDGFDRRVVHILLAKRVLCIGTVLAAFSDVRLRGAFCRHCRHSFGDFHRPPCELERDRVFRRQLHSNDPFLGDAGDSHARAGPGGNDRDRFLVSLFAAPHFEKHLCRHPGRGSFPIGIGEGDGDDERADPLESGNPFILGGHYGGIAERPRGGDRDYRRRHLHRCGRIGGYYRPWDQCHQRCADHPGRRDSDRADGRGRRFAYGLVRAEAAAGQSKAGGEAVLNSRREGETTASGG